MNKIKICAVFVLAVFIHSCGSAPNKFGEDYGAEWQAGNVDVVWSQDIGSQAGGFFALNTTGTNLCVANANGDVYFIDSTDGQVVTQVKLPDGLEAAGACTSERIVAVTDKGIVHGYDANTGQIRWQINLESTLLRPPLLFQNDYLLFFYSSGFVNAYSLTTGDRLWRIKLDAADLRLAGNFEPLIIQDFVFFGMPNGTFYGLQAELGVVRFEQEIFGTEQTQQATGITNIGGVAANSSVICASAYLGQTFCIRGSNFRLAWSNTDNTSGGRLSLSDDQLFFIDPSGALIATDIQTGEENWKVEQASAIRVATTFYIDNKVVVDNGFGGLSIYDAQTGDYVGGHGLNGQLAGIEQDGSDIIIFSNAGELQRLSFTE